MGRFVSNWAQLELALDILVLRARRADSLGCHGSQAPHELAAKIRFLRQAAGKLMPKGSQRAGFSAVLQEIKDLAHTRHAFVHGAAVEHAEERGILTVTLARMLQPSKRPRRAPVKVTVAKINRTSTRISALTDQLFDFAEPLKDLSAAYR